MRRSKVFLDSSVLLAAILSSRGGSFYILSRFKDLFEFQINDYVFEETMSVLDTKFWTKGYLKRRLFLMLGSASVSILSSPTKQETRILRKFIQKEDTPILASALEHSDYLLTLDNDFFNVLLVKFLQKQKLVIIKPREFIQGFKSRI